MVSANPKYVPSPLRLELFSKAHGSPGSYASATPDKDYTLKALDLAMGNNPLDRITSDLYNKNSEIKFYDSNPNSNYQSFTNDNNEDNKYKAPNIAQMMLVKQYLHK